MNEVYLLPQNSELYNVIDLTSEFVSVFINLMQILVHLMSLAELWVEETASSFQIGIHGTL